MACKNIFYMIPYKIRVRKITKQGDNVANKRAPNKCPLCGGNKMAGKTTFTVNLGFGVVNGIII